MSKNTQVKPKEENVSLQQFYETIKESVELLSDEEIDLAIEALKLAEIDAKECEERKRNERQAKRLKTNMEEAKKHRQAAEIREAEKIAKLQADSFEKSAVMDLPIDTFNSLGGFDKEEAKKLHCDGITHGLMASLDSLGIVDIEFISAVTGEKMNTVIERLRGTIYQNPLHWDGCYYKGWEMAEEYLSGNLMHKLSTAQAANKLHPGVFDANIEAIKSIVSFELECDEIYVTLGSPWVPTDIIDEFILHLIGIDKENGKYPIAANPFLQSNYLVRHDDLTGLWEIPEKTRFRNSRAHSKYEEYNNSIYGTPRMEMLYLLENILNMKTIAIYDTPDTRKSTRILNQNETVKALEKQDRMIATFKSWVWGDEQRKSRLQGAYYRKYGSIKKRVFDGSFLELSDMNPDIKLHKHQRDSIARIIFSPNTLLAHDVGAGKTYTMIAAGMELRRLGKSQKNLYVVPNNILSQWEEMFYKMYPKAKLLVVSNKNFSQSKRMATLERIIDEDFDAILMTYSCFDLLSLSKKYYEELYEKRLALLDRASANFHSKADVERKRRSINRTLEKLQENAPRTVCDIPFDELGINTLFVDEAHNYKNVPLDSGISRVKGFNKAGSHKCEGMMDKVHCVQRQNDGGRIILATGTPITNSITDIFVLQKYLQNGELEFLGIQNFDSWVGMFAKKVTEFEIDVDTNSYHLATRFSRFHNVPELTAILSSVADFYHVDKSSGIPELDGYTDSVRNGGEAFKSFLKDISRRADDVRHKKVDRKVDNLLKITTDGRKAALDMRLIDSRHGLDPDSKVLRCAQTVMEIYDGTRDKKLIQMVFCDSSTPKSGFNLYDELKELLVAFGMPENEIAYIHEADSEAKKKHLFAELQKGNISVVIGSTFKMGLGVNVQKRLCALHHLDVPWRPADMVQREGRILRQGNECDNVAIYRYITKGSFDAYSWQLLEAKQRFISQILSGHVTVREGEDVDETVLNYAEVKALSLGNPLIKRRVEIANELDKYKILHRGYLDDRIRKKRLLSELPEKIETQKRRIEDTKNDVAFVAANKNKYKELSREEQKSIREAIYAAAKLHVGKPFDKKVLTYRGFDVVVPAGMQPRMPSAKDEKEALLKNPIPYVYVKRCGSYYLEIETLLGITARLNNLLDGLEDKKLNQEKELERLSFKMRTIKQELSREDNSFIEKIESLGKELEKIDKELGLKTA